MRTPTLQYLYLQKPLVLLLMVTILSVCWIYDGAFYTKGEPREAAVAVSMVEKGEWVLPKVYADEFAYKPPFTHWLMAVFSLPQGEVTPLTSRLPSVVSFVFMIGVCFLFYGRKMRGQEAFLACIILITSFELHRAAMTARVDMVLTCLIVLGLIMLFFWEEDRKLTGMPLGIPVVLGCATLVKGPVGIVLPLLVFGIYLLLLRYNFWKIAGKFVCVTLLSMILPAIWYVLAYRQGGQAFLDLIWAENFGRFFGTTNLNISYELGHEEPFWYNFVTLLSGFIPWTIFLLISLFGIKYTFEIKGIKNLWNNVLSMEKIYLFSLVAAVTIFIFYSIPISKRSVYIMPAYPFIAVFMARYFLYLTEYKNKITKIFSGVIWLLGFVVAIIVFLTVVTHLVEPTQLFGFIKSQRTMSDIVLIWDNIKSANLLNVLLFFILLTALYTLSIHLRKKNNLKILYSAVYLYFVTFLIIDAIFIPAFKNATSVKPFAEEVKAFTEKSDKIYVLNNLKEYRNMYGMNFYLNNNFKNFEKELPESGFFLVGASDFEKFYPGYSELYNFTLEIQSPTPNKDAGQIIQLYSIQKK